MRRKSHLRNSRPRGEVLDPRVLLATLIAEVDTGVQLANQADVPYYDLADGYNAYTQQPALPDGSNVADNSLGATGHGHGSTVADSIVMGIQAAAAAPGGASANAKIMPIRVTNSSGQEDGNTFSAIVRGIFYAAYHHASVINVSIVFLEASDAPAYVPNNPDPSYTNPFPTFANAIAYAQSHGAVVVTGAGNDHYNIDSTDPTQNGYYPDSLYPAADLAPNLIVAASTDSSGNLTSISNYGPVHVTLGAPAIQNATSYAAGYISGVTGAVASLAPGLSANQLAGLIESTGQVYPQLKGIVSTSAVVNPAGAVAAAAPLTVATAASASPSVVTGTSTTLSALGAEPAGASALSYTWTAQSGTGVTFSPAGVNGTNAASSITANFTQPGQYTFQVTIAASTGQSVTSNVAVMVNATATSLSVTPAAAPVGDGTSQVFTATATDQFGLATALPGPVAWSIAPGGVGGTIDASGTYKAPAAGTGEDTIVAQSGALSTSAAVQVAPPLVSSIAIDCGSTSAVGSFQADSGASSGTTDSTTSPIDTSGVLNPAPQAVYQTERWSGDQFSYTLPGLKPGAAYTVRLHFAEIFYNAVGDRRFNVLINGSTVLSNFDIFATAGGADKAVVETFAATPDALGRITIAFANIFGGATCAGIEVIPSSAINTSTLPTPQAVSLGQDGHDVANAFYSPTPSAGPDGVQDVHIALSNLPTNLAIDHVEVDRVGGGGLYRSDGSPWSWTSVVSRASTGQNGYSGSADVFFQPNPNVVDVNQAYQFDIYYVGQKAPVTVFVNVTDNPRLAMPGAPSPPAPRAISLGQDGHDLANAFNAPTPSAGPDGLQDVHVVLLNLPTSVAIDHVVVDRVGGGGLYRSDGSPYSWTSVVTQASAGSGAFADTADVYFQPNPNVIDLNQKYQLNIYYVGQTAPATVFVNVTDNPLLAVPATPAPATPTAVSLGQDGHDVANTVSSPTPAGGADGFQDVHLVLMNLPTNAPLAHVEINRYGGGGLYLSDGSPGSWSTVVAQASTAPGVYADTADVFFQPNPSVTDDDALYEVDLFFAGQSQPVTVYVDVTDDPLLRDSSSSQG